MQNLYKFEFTKTREFENVGSVDDVNVKYIYTYTYMYIYVNTHCGTHRNNGCVQSESNSVLNFYFSFCIHFSASLKLKRKKCIQHLILNLSKKMSINSK